MSSSRSIVIRTVIVAVVGLVAVAVLAPAMAGQRTDSGRIARAVSDPSTPTGISVQGTGRVAVSPDLATISLGIQSQAAKAADAQSQASSVMVRIIRAVKAKGVADADLATQWISLQPQYAYGPDGTVPPRVTGYQAGQNLAVRVHQPDQAGAIIDAAVAAGATMVNGISFSLADPTSATAQARNAAVADARAHASTLAKAAGVTLGAIVSITEVVTPSPAPIPYAADAAIPKAATPVQAGTTEIEVVVQATFAIGA